MNRALFLDRDGVINEDYGYVHKIEDFHFRDGIFDVCRAAQKEHMKIVVVTNQAGIGRGLYQHADFQSVTQYMRSAFSGEGVTISGVYCCPDHPDHGLGHYRRISYDRKPSPGMLVKACNDLNINPKCSVFIGDKVSDREAAYKICVYHYIDATRSNWADLSLKAIRLCS
jgi:D-glycero-D-manno-heptose 1,7-bisphosphate phosphatase